MISRAQSGGFSNSADHAAASYIIPWPAEIAPTLNAHFGDKMGLENQHINGGAGLFVHDVQATTHAFKVRGGCEGGGKGYLGSDEVAFTISTHQDQHIFSEPVVYALQDVRGLDKKQNGKGWSDEGVSYTVDTHATQGVAHTEPAIGFDAYNNDVTGDVSKTVDTGQDYHHVPIAFQPTADCLTAAYGTKWNGNASATNGSLFAQQQSTVRRLTPRECERLQGFPDDYTLVPHRNKPMSDGPRYKALGNSMAVPVMHWIGKRIQMIEDMSA